MPKMVGTTAENSKRRTVRVKKRRKRMKAKNQYVIMHVSRMQKVVYSIFQDIEIIVDPEERNKAMNRDFRFVLYLSIKLKSLMLHYNILAHKVAFVQQALERLCRHRGQHHHQVYEVRLSIQSYVLELIIIQLPI